MSIKSRTTLLMTLMTMIFLLLLNTLCNKNPLSENQHNSRIKKEIHIDSDGLIEYTIDYSYDSNDRLIRTNHYNKENQLTYYELGSYTLFDSLRKIDYYDTNGLCEDSTTFEYDSKRQKIIENHYFDNDNNGYCELVIYCKYDYNNQGYLIKETWLYPPDDDLEWYKIYRYNSSNQLIKVDQFLDSNSTTADEYAVYNYGTNGKVSGIDNYFVSYTGNVETSGYEVYQYDSQERLIKIEFFDAISDELTFIEYKYE